MDYLEIRELYHHGILGQKWGIRRYQNEDGTLTEKGKKRYRINDIKSQEEIDKMTGHEKRASFRKERKGLAKRESDKFSLLEKQILNNQHDSDGNSHYVNNTGWIAKRRADKALAQKYGKNTIRQVKAENAAMIATGATLCLAALTAKAAIELKKLKD